MIEKYIGLFFFFLAAIMIISGIRQRRTGKRNIKNIGKINILFGFFFFVLGVVLLFCKI